jgi:hypothetical protein
MGQRGITSFTDDIKKGVAGEIIFQQDFLDFLGINYQNVTGCQQYQVIDTDYLTKIGTYEIKSNYKDNDKLIFEEYTNYNAELGKISLGWLYKTTADLIVFVSKDSRTMIFLPFTEAFKLHYATIRDETKLNMNRVTVYGNCKWQSAFRIVPFELLNGFISVYVKKNSNGQTN